MRRGLLAAVDDGSVRDFDNALKECVRLAFADGIEIVETLSQKSRKMDPNTALRSGKLEELSDVVRENDIEVVVFLNNLNENIIGRIKDATECTIIDRTSLILDIFSLRARSREAMIQIEMAKLKYSMSSRIRLNDDHERKRGGGVNNRGEGESRDEIIYRNTNKRIAELKDELIKIEKAKREKDNHRRKSMLKKVALVGYTNAGKSSFMNAMLEMCNKKDKNVESKDMLFATLDPSIRKVSYKNYEFLLFDTVGFVSNLPHELIEAFNSTLSYAKDADLLLNIIDSSSSDFEHESYVTRDTLKRIGADDIPVIDVYNKIDLSSDRSLARYEVSSLTLEGFEGLLDKVVEIIYKKEDTGMYLVPYEHMGLISEYRNKTDISIVENTDEGILVRISGLKEYLKAFKAFEVQ